MTEEVRGAAGPGWRRAGGGKAGLTRARRQLGVFPRVNAANIRSFTGKRVALVGRVLRKDEVRVVLQASDGGEVSVTQSPGSSYSTWVARRAPALRARAHPERRVVGAADARGAQRVRGGGGQGEHGRVGARGEGGAVRQRAGCVVAQRALLRRQG